MPDIGKWIEAGRLRSEGTYETYAAARQDAESEGRMVCGYRVDGAPRYFTMSATATDTEVSDRVFFLRHGREPSPTERDLLAIAEQAQGAR